MPTVCKGVLDLASCLMHPSGFLNCLAGYREQNHTCDIPFGIITSQPPIFRFWLPKNYLFIWKKLPNRFILILCSDFRKASTLFICYFKIILNSFVQSLLNELFLYWQKVNLIAPITSTKAVQSIQLYYICALKFTLLLPVANCKQ